MTSLRPLSTYEKLVPLKRIPYWIFYLVIGAFLFVATGSVLNSFGEDGFVALRICIAFVAGVLPILLIQFSKAFIATSNDLSIILWEDPFEFEQWRNAKYIYIFTLESTQSKVVSFGLVIAVFITLFVVSFPFNNQSLRMSVSILITVLAFVLAQSAYICAQLLMALAEIVKKTPHLPFLRLPHPSIDRLYNDYSVLSFLLSVGYALLFWTAWESFGLSIIILIWLSVLACYPLVTFIWSFTQIHVLMQKIKQSYIEIINRQVQTALQKVTETQDVDDYDGLNKAIEIQGKTQNLPEWPISLSGSITFFVTTIAAIIQITLSILQMINLGN